MESIRTASFGMAKVLLALLLATIAAFVIGIVAQPAQQAHAAATQVMYRMYNPNSGEHFYTKDSNERDSLRRAGWNYEGPGWTAPVSSSTPVYRLYSGTDHHYTTNPGERDNLRRAGWSYEGIGWYSDDSQGVPLYRQFNPNVNPNASRNNSGSHNYTVNKAENDNLVRLGWRAEGIGWYGVNTSVLEQKLKATHVATIKIKDYGTITLDLYGEAAPKTVEYFVSIAEKGYYNMGLSNFPRIIKGFMMQSSGAPDFFGFGSVKGEFATNGFANPVSHTRGAISMARGNDPNSGSSAFFIVHQDSTFLDGNYAAFGHVTSGMDVVDKICETVPVKPTYTDKDGNTKDGEVESGKEPVIESISVREL